MAKIVIILYKIFFVGLLVQFFAQTLVTYGMGIDLPYLWLWKEVVIGLLAVVGAAGIIVRGKRRQLWVTPTIGRWTLGLIVTIAITAYIHLYVLQEPQMTYFLAFKYDFLGFIILLAGLHSSARLDQSQRKEIIHRYGRVIKKALLLALLWYLLILVKPGTLKLFGYDNFIYEGSVGAAPPAAYYTQINYGLTRNQFLFERPISWGFFLTAFFPLFFVLFLYKQKVRNTRGWRGVYALNVILTFSRAARGARLVELFVISCIAHRGHIKKFALKVLLPIVICIGAISYLGYEHIFEREYSNTGHVAMLQQGREMFMQDPVFGQGGASAGPGSHREEGSKFNPENQFLQILIEFGLIGFLGWMILYLILNIVGIQERYNRNLRGKKITRPLRALVAMSVGMIGLSVSGMVLHSFTDRMIVYPMMLLYGIVWMRWAKRK